MGERRRRRQSRRDGWRRAGDGCGNADRGGARRRHDATAEETKGDEQRDDRRDGRRVGRRVGRRDGRRVGRRVGRRPPTLAAERAARARTQRWWLSVPGSLA